MEYSDLDQLQKLIQHRGGLAAPSQNSHNSMAMNQSSSRASNNNSRSLRRVSVRESQQEEPIYFD